MRKNNRIKQVIIVEGKTDTEKLRQIFGPELETIETNGLNLNEQTINLIRKVNENQGIIVFTDPDGPGKRIRQRINDALDGEVLHAFITKNDIEKPIKKIGIAEADSEAIKRALGEVITFNQKKSSITWKEYLHHDFYLKSNRKLISRHFGFDEKTNNKTLFKWINWMGLSVNDLNKILDEERKKNREWIT